MQEYLHSAQGLHYLQALVFATKVLQQLGIQLSWANTMGSAAMTGGLVAVQVFIPLKLKTRKFENSVLVLQILFILGWQSFSVLPSIKPWVTFVLTLLAMTPVLRAMWKLPDSRLLMPALTYCCMCSFMLGFHVHEKAIIMIIIVSKYAVVYWCSICWFTFTFNFKSPAISINSDGKFFGLKNISTGLYTFKLIHVFETQLLW